MIVNDKKLDRIIRSSYDYKALCKKLMEVYGSKEKMKESEEYKKGVDEIKKRAKWISYLV